MQRVFAGICFIFMSPTMGLADDDPTSKAPPSWFLHEIQTLTAGAGRWITNNSNYKSSDEPYDEYGSEWHASFDGTTISFS